MPSSLIKNIRSTMRLRGYSLRADKYYLYCIRCFIRLSITGVILNN